LAHSKSALKRWRQNEAHRERNRSVRTAARSAVKKAHGAIERGSSEEAQAEIRTASSILDRASKSGVVHRNAVARHKSRMMRQAARSAAPPAEPAKKTSTRARTGAVRKAPAKPRAARPRAPKAKE